MKSKLIATVSALIVSVILIAGPVLAQGIYAAGTVGIDVSWPNCNSKISNTYSFGIVGVNDGLGYSTNPCLASEALHFNNLSLYVNTGWNINSSHIDANNPRSCANGDNNCLAYNYGYNAGIYAFNTASSAGVHSTTWWLDVETDNTWSNDVTQNQSSLQGEADALNTSGVGAVGIYSTTAQWQSITGGWQNGLPNWGATTWTTARQAAKYCSGHDFTGGGTWLIQFRGKLDQDFAC